MSVRLGSVAVVLLLVVAACGDDDGGGTTTSAGGGVTTAPPAPTELRFTFDGVTGVDGRILVAMVSAADGAIVGTACLPADADPFSGMAVVATAAPDNPCGHDAPYGVPLTTAGAFTYFVAAFEPGSQVTEIEPGEVHREHRLVAPDGKHEQVPRCSPQRPNRQERHRHPCQNLDG